MAVVVGPDGIDRLETVVVELLKDNSLVAGAFNSGYDPGDRGRLTGSDKQQGDSPEDILFHRLKRFAG